MLDRRWFNPALISLTAVSAIVNLFMQNQMLQFSAACIALLMWAAVMGYATENIAILSSESIGGFLNATFGNAAELLIGAFLIKEGLFDMVKASITGSIIGNLLLVFGLSALLGGLKYKAQHFNPVLAGHNASLMILAVISLFIPAIFLQNFPSNTINNVSLIIAITLIVSYFLWLYFVLVSHKHELGTYIDSAPIEQVNPLVRWSKSKSILILALSTVIVAIHSEWIVLNIRPVATQLGWSEPFIGAFLIAIIGNAAEHSAAIFLALKNKMEAAVEIAIGSSLQIALFVAPILVIFSFIIGNPMNLLFHNYEIATIAVAAMITSSISRDGSTNWYEGFLLLTVYLILGSVYFVQK